MRYQSTSFWCGPASMAAAARCLGRNIGQQRLAKLAGTDDEGTDEDQVRRALLAVGLFPERHSSSIMLASRNWLVLKLRLGYPVILAVGKQRWSHWVTAVGMIGNKFVVFDPARYEYLVNSGVRVLPWKRMMAHWKAPKTVCGSEGCYYGLAVMVQNNDS